MLLILRNIELKIVNASFRGHQFAKESAEEILKHSLLLLVEKYFVIKSTRFDADHSMKA